MKFKSHLHFSLLIIYALVPLLMGASNGELGGGGCGSIPASSSDITLTSILVTPTEQSILIHSTQQYTATGEYSDGSTADITPLVEWTSSDTSLVVIDAVGLATAGSEITSTPLAISAELDSIVGSAMLSIQDNTPVVSEISPSSGPSSGGTSVTITGTGFTGATAVNFGVTAATAFSVDSDASITATSPAGTGTVDVTVTTNYGTSAASVADQFLYADGPTVSGVSPNLGLTAGGTNVTINGAHFSGATSVNFGGTTATGFIVNSDTSITASSPAASAGTVDITVTTPYGTSAISSADEFSYGDIPAVTGVSPNAGPTTGGTSVTVSGTNLTDTTSVNFGSTAASFILNSDSSITAISPASSAGTVNMTVTTPYGTSSTSSADEFTYIIPSSLDGVSPSSGPASGGTGITLTGNNLTDVTSVLFGGQSATSVNVINSTTVTAVTPAHAAGVVDVEITTPTGSATLPNGYTYLSTAVGQASGGGTIACLNAGLSNLIASTADNSVGIEWGGIGIAVNSSSNTDGASNTSLIVSLLGNNGGTPYAAQLCTNYEVDSQGNTPCEVGNTCYNDWFLPALDQLNCLYVNQIAIGGFDPVGNYWSSKDAPPNNNNASYEFFTAGIQDNAFRGDSGLRVRCVRGFTP